MIIPVVTHAPILVIANAALRPLGRDGRCPLCGTPWINRKHVLEWQHQRDVARIVLLSRGLLPVSSSTARKVAKLAGAVWVVARAPRIASDQPLECWVDPWQLTWITADPSIPANAQRQGHRARAALARYPEEAKLVIEKAVKMQPLFMVRPTQVRLVAIGDAMVNRWGLTSSRGTAAEWRRGRSRRSRAASRG